ncbi:MAG: rod shape-determining protein MreC [Bacteroidota bacterium]
MRNLIRFIIRNHFFILFIIFEIIAFSMLVNQNAFQRSTFSSGTRAAMGRVYDNLNFFKQYLNLRETNRALQRENRELKNLLKQNYETSLTEFIEIDDSLYNQHFKYTEAKVINNSVNKQHNYLILNRGERHDVEVEMGVVSPNGLVGIVTATSPNFSTVISLLNVDTRISAKIKKNDYFGSLIWDGKDYQRALLREIPYHVNISEHDTIVTSGFSSVFPEGIRIGTIESFNAKGGNFYEIIVKLSNDFKQLSNVYIVKNLLKEEQENALEVTQNR